jgi:hypothetical protein
MFGEDKKSRSRDCFSVMASLSVHRFDHALAYDVFYILPVVFLKKKKKKKKNRKKKWGEFAGFFFFGLLDIVCILA